MKHNSTYMLEEVLSSKTMKTMAIFMSIATLFQGILLFRMSALYDAIYDEYADFFLDLLSKSHSWGFSVPMADIEPVTFKFVVVFWFIASCLILTGVWLLHNDAQFGSVDADKRGLPLLRVGVTIKAMATDLLLIIFIHDNYVKESNDGIIVLFALVIILLISLFDFQIQTLVERTAKALDGKDLKMNNLLVYSNLGTILISVIAAIVALAFLFATKETVFALSLLAGSIAGILCGCIAIRCDKCLLGVSYVSIHHGGSGYLFNGSHEENGDTHSRDPFSSDRENM